MWSKLGSDGLIVEMAVLRRRYLRVGRRSTLQVKLYVDVQHESWFTEKILEVRRGM